jgi:hypothetical protein
VTSGLQSCFTINARDAFDNRPLSSTFVTYAKFRTELSNLFSRGIVSASSDSTYTANLPSLRSGSASLTVALSNVGGLMAAYRDGIASAAPSLVRRDPTVMLAAGTAAAPADRFGTDFSVHWQGLVSAPNIAPNTATYTFYTELAAADERVRLWLDNSLVVEEWSSLSSLVPSATFSMTASTLHEIELEYQNRAGSYGFRLLWTGTGTRGRSLVPSSSLHTALHIASSPFALTVQRGSGCAAASIARGPGLSLATAGVAAHFTVDVRDAYGDAALEHDGLVVLAGPTRVTGTVAWANGEVQASYTATVTGAYSALFGLVQRGGLLATYYDSADLRSMPSKVQLDTAVMFEWRPPALITKHSRDHVSVRWFGMLEAPLTEEFTFFWAINTANCGRVRIGENVLINAPCRVIELKRINAQLIDIPISLPAASDVTELYATAQLIAGRRYELEIEWSKTVGHARSELR